MYDFKASLDEVIDEMVEKTLQQREAKAKTYGVLKSEGLPVPPDLQREIGDHEEDVAYVTGYRCGKSGVGNWSDEYWRDKDAWKMGYEDGYGDSHS